MRQGAIAFASLLTGLAAGFTALTFVQCSSDDPGGSDPSDASEGSTTTNDGSFEIGPPSEGGPVGDAGSNALGPYWLAYGTAAGKTGVRPWDDIAGGWGVEQAGPSETGSNVRWVVPKETPVGSFLAVASSTTSGGKLDVFRRADDGTWKVGFSVPMANATRRAFDIEYETKTRAVVVVYGDLTPVLKMRRFVTSWGVEQSLPMLETNLPAWIELARNPIANEVGLVYVDEGSRLVGESFDGTTWSAPRELDAQVNTLDFKAFDAAYENNSGKLLAVWGRAGTEDGGDVLDTRYSTHPLGGTWADPTSMTPGTPAGPITLAPEIASNRIANAYLGYVCNKTDLPCDDFDTAIWDGTSFTSAVTLDPDTTTLYHSRPSSMPTGIAWLGGSGTAVSAFHRGLPTGGDQLAFSTFSDLKWDPVAGAAAPPALPARASMQLVSAPGPTVVANVLDTAGALWAKGFRLSGATTSWADVGGGVSLVTGLTAAGAVPFGATTIY